MNLVSFLLHRELLSTISPDIDESEYAIEASRTLLLGFPGLN